MARWETVECSKCKKEVPMKDGNRTAGISVSTKSVCNNGSMSTTGEHYDLCDECYKSLGLWMKGVTK
jgi:hypothetical protein